MATITLAGAAQAATPLAIAGLYNTGVNASHDATSGLTTDQHWSVLLADGVTMTPGIAYNGGANGTFPIGPWLAEDVTSRWVGPTEHAGDSTDPLANGYYQYDLHFNLTTAQALGATFNGRFAADNAVAWIKLNDATLTSGQSGGFTYWTDFAATDSSAFHAGVNDVSFRVINFGQPTGNPSGLRVEFQGATIGVPEPASWALMISGFGMAGAMLRRRRPVAVAA